MVNHSFWHQRALTTTTYPVCPVCGNGVAWDPSGDGYGYRCGQCAALITPLYVAAPHADVTECPYKELHDASGRTPTVPESHRVILLAAKRITRGIATLLFLQKRHSAVSAVETYEAVGYNDPSHS